MIRTQVQLTEEPAHTLNEISHRENASIAELTRRTIAQWLQTTSAIPMPERRRRALAVVGRFRSGQIDVSERRGEYQVGICSGQVP
jgi:hypothetical protein